MCGLTGSRPNGLVIGRPYKPLRSYDPGNVSGIVQLKKELIAPTMSDDGSISHCS